MSSAMARSRLAAQARLAALEPVLSQNVFSIPASEAASQACMLYEEQDASMSQSQVRMCNYI